MPGLVKDVVSFGRKLLMGGKALLIGGDKYWYGVPCMMTLAEMLATQGVPNMLVCLTDYHAPLFKWDPAQNRFLPTAPWRVVADTTVYTRLSANVAADTNDALLATYQIPGGVIGLNSTMTVRWWYDTTLTTTATKSVACKINQHFIPVGSLAPDAYGGRARTSVVNLMQSGSTSLQMSSNNDSGWSGSTAPVKSYDIDTSQTMTLGVYGKFNTAVAGEDVRLRFIEVIIWP